MLKFRTVYGFTNEKHTRSIELSVDTIVENEIDPWRLDLFDDDPVILSGSDLRFRRLRDFAFAYPNPRNDSEMFLCSNDGTTATCLVGKWRSADFKNFIGLVRPSQSSFAAHLHEYLSDGERSNRYPPMQRTGITVTGAELCFEVFGSHFARNAINFTGHMLEELAAPTELDERINRVLIALEPWNPIVVGTTLRQSLDGKRPQDIDLYLDPAGLHWLTTQLNYSYTFPDRSCQFRHGDCNYRVWKRAEGFSIRNLITTEARLLSADWLCSMRPNQLFGSRIGLFDCARHQCRGLIHCGLSARTLDSLEANGLKFVDSGVRAEIA